MSMHAFEWTDIGFRALALAWSDEGFKRALLQDSRGALKAYFGYDVPEGVNLVVTEGARASHDTDHLVLSPRPTGLEDGRVDAAVDPDSMHVKGYLCCVCC